jgi:hypothetical protein
MMPGVVRQAVKVDGNSVAAKNFLKHQLSSIFPKYRHGLGMRHPVSAIFDDISDLDSQN